MRARPKHGFGRRIARVLQCQSFLRECNYLSKVPVSILLHSQGYPPTDQVDDTANLVMKGSNDVVTCGTFMKVFLESRRGSDDGESSCGNEEEKCEGDHISRKSRRKCGLDTTVSR
jgi:hypothetical protein